MGVHDGHRKRTKDRVLNSELDAIDDHVLLETLLYYAIPRTDTNELAHALLSRFGSFDGVLEAEYADLKQVEGIGDNAAFLITLVTKLNKRYQTTKSTTKKVYIKNVKSACAYFKKKFEFETREMAYVLLLDSGNGVIRCEKLSSGVVNATDVCIRRIVELALKYNAAHVIVSHNHPDSLPFPSQEDENSTRKIRDALDLVGIDLLDHIIVGEDKSMSLTDRTIM